MSGPADVLDEHAAFAFITQQNRDSARSHAMRGYWRQRRRRLAKDKKPLPDSALLLRRKKKLAPIMPRRQCPPCLQSNSSSASGSLQRDASPSPPRLSLRLSTSSCDDDRLSITAESIRSQVMSGMNRALGSNALDPFDMGPVKLTAEHQRLLHHWLSVYAPLMFSDLPTSVFNPMRDIWLPLDLSNAAAFNIVMALSATHLARMQGQRHTPPEALRFKGEAINIISTWVNDNTMALSDQAMTGILRLLTYERHCGPQTEWKIHHDALTQMINARGGISALQCNWRLQLLASQITCMSTPSWFCSTNQIDDIASQSGAQHLLASPDTNATDRHRIRGLWYLSVAQDISNSIVLLPGITEHCLLYYPELQTVVALIQADIYREGSSAFRSRECEGEQYKRLSCILFLAILIQESSCEEGLHHRATLEDHLATTKELWQNSVQRLHTSIFHSYAVEPSRRRMADYALKMSDILRSMSAEARYGVESSIIYTICLKVPGLATGKDGICSPVAFLSQFRGIPCNF